MTFRLVSSARFVICCGLLILPGIGSARAATFRVGVGTGCTHVTVELAVAAAAANGPGLDEIYIAYASETLGSLVEVDGHSVSLVGGFSSCTAASPTGRTTLRRLSPSDAFYVHASSGAAVFSLQGITVDMGGSAFRALRLEGEVQAVLADTVLTDGQAPPGGDGGNVWMGGNASLILIGSEISLGLAGSGSGGGVYCENGGTVFVDVASEVRDNESHATDLFTDTGGGGIFADACSLEIRGRILDNDAFDRNGGGIHATGGSSLSLYGPGIDDFYVLSGNQADQGGGLYLSGAGTTAVARNVWIGGNNAHLSGGGVHVGPGASFTMDVEPQTCPLGRVSSGRSCSEFYLNSVENGSPGFGGGAMNVVGTATVRQTGIWKNYGPAPVAYVSGTMVLEGCGIEGNDRLGINDLSRFEVSGSLTVAFATIVERTETGDVFAVFNGADIRLFSSIVQADQTFAWPPGSSTIDCVVTREQSSFPAGGTLLTTVTDPTLLFATWPGSYWEFRLKRGSIAQDYCDTFLYVPTDDDIDNQIRGHDDPLLPDIVGPYDLGFDEWRPEIFSDGFESANVSHWSMSVP